MRAVKNNQPTPSGEVEESEALAGRMVRLGVSVGGRMRKLRAVGDHLARPQGQR